MKEHHRAQHIRELEAQLDLISEKIARLRQALAIETDPATKFKLEKQVESAEIERGQLEQNLEALEQNQPVPTPQQAATLSQDDRRTAEQELKRLKTILDNHRTMLKRIELMESRYVEPPLELMNKKLAKEDEIQATEQQIEALKRKLTS